MSSQRGSVFIYVSVLIGVLVIMGVTFSFVAGSGVTSVGNITNRTRAFYIAEAGLAWGREEIQAGRVNLTHMLLGEERVVYRSSVFGSTVGVQVLSDIGDIEVTVLRNTLSRYTLNSRGYVNGVVRQVRTTVDYVMDVEDTDIVSMHRMLTLTDMRNTSIIRGDIKSQSYVLAIGAQIVGNRVTAENTYSFLRPTVVTPAGLPNRGNFTVSTGGSGLLPGSGVYGTIRVSNRGLLMINVPSSDDVVIVVNSLDLRVDTRINITGAGAGRVRIYVLGGINLRDGVVINSGGSVSRLRIHYVGASALRLTRNTNMTGFLVVNTALVELSTSFNLNGHLLSGGSVVELRTGARVTGVVYAPVARVDMFDTARVDGLMVSNSVVMRDSSQVNRATGGFTSFLSSVGEYNLWGSMQGGVIFHTWRIYE